MSGHGSPGRLDVEISSLGPGEPGVTGPGVARHSLRSYQRSYGRFLEEAAQRKARQGGAPTTAGLGTRGKGAPPESRAGPPALRSGMEVYILSLSFGIACLIS